MESYRNVCVICYNDQDLLICGPNLVNFDIAARESILFITASRITQGHCWSALPFLFAP